MVHFQPLPVPSFLPPLSSSLFNPRSISVPLTRPGVSLPGPPPLLSPPAAPADLLSADSGSKYTVYLRTTSLLNCFRQRGRAHPKHCRLFCTFLLACPSTHVPRDATAATHRNPFSGLPHCLVSFEAGRGGCPPAAAPMAAFEVETPRLLQRANSDPSINVAAARCDAPGRACGASAAFPPSFPPPPPPRFSYIYLFH